MVKISEAPFISVVAAVVQRNQAFLVCRRPQGKEHGGLWEFPGGKVEACESPGRALTRELLEELELTTTTIGECLFSHQEEGSPYRINFFQVEISGEPVALEHSEVSWVPRDRLRSYPLAPTDKLFVEFMLERNL